jgi:hypothetical protein
MKSVCMGCVLIYARLFIHAVKHIGHSNWRVSILSQYSHEQRTALR